MTTTILLIILIVLIILNIFLTITKKQKDNSEDLKTNFIKLDTGISKVDPLIRDEFGRNREESQKSFKENREELNNSFKLLGDTLTKTVSELSNTQKGQFETFSNRQEQIKKDSEINLKEIRETVEKKLQILQEENSKKLDEMRKVVDEKLQETVEKRFNESFKLISDRLEQVHKGLGEMQLLASGVGDLKKVLTNVKTRGNLGEIQLGAILEQILSPEQYEQNAIIKEGSQERVEYVIKLPGKNNDNKSLLLPVDSKFPNEDYQRLLETYENIANLTPRDIEIITKQFENSVKKNAKDIRDKYINPPVTTDFAIMFVPTEGLYAEILRRTGLFEILQRDFKITVVGPTNLVAFLSSLQMGFKTLAIEKRSSEVWEILGAVKTQFSTFGDILEKTKKKLQQAASVIDQAGVKSRAIERKLRNVQELPSEQTIELLGEAIEIEEDSRVKTDDDDE
ncbi:DNA recombination protein RmuC [Bacteroidia bacterium]|nr:DNA recombination protein RmuC [Bacteroidia bacterium]GHT26911.1 DNA recombination protein RmuC [Bacteroidia bacterium]GHV70707.1 DNA recombination protein RmuC [Bacteroidia bacterium]